MSHLSILSGVLGILFIAVPLCSHAGDQKPVRDKTKLRRQARKLQRSAKKQEGKIVRKQPSKHIHKRDSRPVLRLVKRPVSSAYASATPVRVAGVSMIVAGSAVLVLGAGFTFVAEGSHTEALRLQSRSQQSYTTLAERGNGFRTASYIALPVGGVSLITGFVFLMMRPAPEVLSRTEPPSGKQVRRAEKALLLANTLVR
ncbi:MAG: hypothetical protein AAGJ35_10930 [Myxococcota bacterium]